MQGTGVVFAFPNVTGQGPRTSGPISRTIPGPDSRAGVEGRGARLEGDEGVWFGRGENEGEAGEEPEGSSRVR